MDDNIYDLIKGRRRYLSETKIKRYMYQLLRGVAHMHKYVYFELYCW